MAETFAYKVWLSGGRYNSALVDTIEVSHDDWVPSSVYLANWDRDFIGTIEGDLLKDFSATRFGLEQATVTGSTAQTTSVVISSLDGLLYSLFKSMTPEQRLKPVTIKVRQYLSSDFTSMVNDTPMVWTLSSVTADLTTLRGELSATPLRVQRVGTYYTANNFPQLRYAR